MSVAIIGSGLAAMSAARALVDRGVKPVVLDIGKTLEPERAALVHRMAAMSPEQWSDDDRVRLFANSTLRQKKPKKLAFGSDYLYGPSSAGQPPSTEAEGGFSVAWGASVLPPDDVDLQAWPIRTAALMPHYQRVLRGLPYAARDDRLSKHFPILHNDAPALELSRGSNDLLHDLERGLESEPHVAFGQARVLTRASDCRYCGECLSGCVYGAIYSSPQTLHALSVAGKIEHRSGVRVEVLREEQGRVVVVTDGGSHTFDRVFLAAGALGSTTLVMRSKRLFDTEMPMLSTGGFVVPLLRARPLRHAWPRANTQPGVFLEMKDPSLSEHWVHTQLSTLNELAFEVLGAKSTHIGAWGRLKRRALQHVVVAHANFHSNHANRYLLRLTNDGDATTLHARVEDRADVHVAHRSILRRLARLMRRCGCYALTPVAQHGKHGDSFHVGGSLPMRDRPEGALDTDTLGTPQGFTRVHVVDSSVFPSLPGTTVGLLAMANASRIAHAVDVAS